MADEGNDDEIVIKITAKNAAKEAFAETSADVKALTGELGASNSAALGLGDKLSAAFQHPIEFVKGLASGINTELNAQLGAAGITAESLKSTINSFIDSPVDAIKGLAKEFSSGLVDSLGLTGIVLGGVVAGMYELSKAALEVAEHWAHVGEEIMDASEKMSVSVEHTSQLKFAVEAAGGSLNQLSSAIFMMQNRMDASPKQFGEGLRDIGLSLDYIRTLSPDEKFLAIARAIHASGDETNQQRVAMELFGRAGREILPLIHKDLDQLIQDGIDVGATWSKDDAEAAEKLAIHTRELGLAWDEMKRHMESWLVGPADFVIEKLNEIARGLGAIRAQRGEEFGTNIFSDLREGPPLPKPVGRDIDLQPGLGTIEAPSFADEQAALDRDMAASKERERAQKQAIKDAKDYATAVSELMTLEQGRSNIIQSLDGNLVELIRYDLQNGANVELLAKVYRLTKEEVGAVNDQYKEEKKNAESLAKVLEHLAEAQAKALPINKLPLNGELVTEPWSTGNVGSLAPDISKQSAGVLERVGPGVFDGFEKLVSSEFPKVALRAIEGGGHIPEALGSAFGTKLGENITKDTSKILGDTFGKTIGGVIGSVLPGIGSLAGGLLGKGIDALLHIGGPSKEELQGRQVEGDFEKSHGGFEQMMKDVNDAYVATGRGAAAAEQDIQKLLAAEKKGGDAAKQMVDQINQAFNDQKKDAADTEAAIKKYGFSFDELGPALKRQKLGEQAIQIENDFRLLGKAGIDINAIIGKMGPDINEFVQASKRAGTEIPTEMKPILETMIKNKQLVDENGNAYDSLDAAGLTFSETMTQGFDRIVKGLKEVVSVLAGVKHGVDDIPSNKTIHIGVTQDHDIPTPDEGPGPSGPPIDEPPAFPTEAFVRYPTLAMVGDVAGGEFVLRPSTIQRWLNAAASAGAAGNGGPAVTNYWNIDINGVLDEGGLVAVVEQKVLPMITAAWQDNRGSARTTATEALGIAGGQ